MSGRRVMRSVLHNFLGTYCSRYSDFRGYWLFGQLPSNVEQLRFDLLASAPPGMDELGETLTEAARRHALRRFAEQVLKSGLTLDAVREAELEICWLPEAVKGRQGDSVADGRKVRISARCITTRGHVYQDHRIVFVAPHDPGRERRRLEEDWGN